MSDKSVETFCPFGVLKAHLPLNYTTHPPSPQTMLDFLSLELASFLCNIEKGEWGGSQCKQDLKWNK